MRRLRPEGEPSATPDTLVDSRRAAIRKSDANLTCHEPKDAISEKKKTAKTSIPALLAGMLGRLQKKTRNVLILRYGGEGVLIPVRELGRSTPKR